jgi:phosphate starvation-inducible PhoH-like protein
MIFGIGPAGTGKTYLAVAARWVPCSRRRSRASCWPARGGGGEKLGFLPGDLQEKVDPYLRPLYDALYDLMEYEKVTRLSRGTPSRWRPRLHARPDPVDAFVIIDEAQNTTPEQMKMVLTRIGFGSKVW